MEIIKKTVTLLWKCWFLLVTTILVLIIGIFWTFPLTFSPKTFPLAYKGIRLWAILVFYSSGFRLDFQKEKTTLNPTQPYIFISNHTSILDIMVMAIIHKHHPIVFVGKEELTKLPIFGTIYKQICITVDRLNAKSKARVFHLAKEKINLGKSIVIFPEGGIPDDESIVLQRFKDGAFSIAITSKVPIAVYSIKGLKEMFPWSWSRGYPGKVHVKRIDIVSTENLSLQDKDEVREICYQKLYNDLTN
ncbi:MAG: lysophospholipid acyltransferase family protein [Moheibacter sp.]